MGSRNQIKRSMTIGNPTTRTKRGDHTKPYHGAHTTMTKLLHYRKTKKNHHLYILFFFHLPQFFFIFSPLFFFFYITSNNHFMFVISSTLSYEQHTGSSRPRFSFCLKKKTNTKLKYFLSLTN